MPYHKEDPLGAYRAIEGGGDGNVGDKHFASDTYAKLIREQYDDWLNRYYPKQERLMQLGTNNELMNAQLGRTDGIAANSLQSAQLGLNNQMARYGTVRAQNPQDNTLGLRSALAIAGAKNGIREAQQDRQMNILTGGAAPVRQQLNIGGGNNNNAGA
ncbi:TPA: hypothetical protein ACWV5T_002331 [Salmonella enterica subsp. enterica serovar Muenchen]